MEDADIFFKAMQSFDTSQITLLEGVQNVQRDEKVLQLLESAYMDKRIFDEISSTLKTQSSINVSFRDLQGEVIVIGKNKSEVKRYLSKITYIMTGYYNFLLAKYQHVRKRPLQLVVFLTNCSKSLPENDEELEPYNVNTGFTWFRADMVYDNIVIYRKEEVFKVLIHELTHFFHLDKAPLQPSLEKDIQRYLKVGNDLRLWEAITDFWAMFVNILFCAILDGKTRYIDRVKAYLAKETEFVAKQAAKVMVHDRVCSESIQYRVEKTHVIAYYLVKAAMFANFSKYIQDYRTIDAKPIFNRDIVQDVRDFLQHKCKNINNVSFETPSLCMSSLDVATRMKTI